MDELITNIMNKWKNAPLDYYRGEANFTLMNTSAAHEFIKLLETWRVPHNVEEDYIYMHIKTLDYWYVMQHKEYYSNNYVTAEIEDAYYA